MNNDTIQVRSLEEYNKQMKNGLNKFLEHGDSELVLNEKPENSNQYVTLTIVPEGEEPENVTDSKVNELSFEDCNGEFNFVLLGNTHFRFTVSNEPNWNEIKMNEHIGEAVHFLLNSDDSNVAV